MEKRKRGRPRKTVDKENTKQPKKQYKYTFTSAKCRCAFKSDIRGCAMFCIHKHPMDIITENY